MINKIFTKKGDQIDFTCEWKKGVKKSCCIVCYERYPEIIYKVTRSFGKTYVVLENSEKAAWLAFNVHFQDFINDIQDYIKSIKYDENFIKYNK